jgi:hypothetical protein
MNSDKPESAKPTEPAEPATEPANKEYDDIKSIIQTPTITDANLEEIKESKHAFVKVDFIFERTTVEEEIDVINPFLGTRESAQYYADYYGNLISFNRYIFDNTVNLLSKEEYNYELPLFGGYFQTSDFKMDASLIRTYIDYRRFNNSYLSDREITYPDYSGLVENVTNPNMCFRYICFKYTVNPKTIVNRGLCMIQLINNNFTMDPSTYIIGEHLNDMYYNNYLIKYKIITLDGGLETAWLSLQAVTPNNINFTENYFYDGALASEPFISDDKTEYRQSATNRIFVIPPCIENIGFDMYIRLGIPKGDRAGFQYISTCFNRV